MCERSKAIGVSTGGSRICLEKRYCWRVVLNSASEGLNPVTCQHNCCRFSSKASYSESLGDPGHWHFAKSSPSSALNFNVEKTKVVARAPKERETSRRFGFRRFPSCRYSRIYRMISLGNACVVVAIMVRLRDAWSLVILMFAELSAGDKDEERFGLGRVLYVFGCLHACLARKHRTLLC